MTLDSAINGYYQSISHTCSCYNFTFKTERLTGFCDDDADSVSLVAITFEPNQFHIQRNKHRATHDDTLLLTVCPAQLAAFTPRVGSLF